MRNRQKDRWRKIRQWKYCPDCQQKMTKECEICRQKICPLCDLGLIWDENHGTIHKTCQTQANNQLQEINIETIRGLSYEDRLKVLIVRKDWLKRQRMQDRREVMGRMNRIYRRIMFNFWIKQGRCLCKEHDIIFKSNKCLLCYGRELKRRREENAERKKLHQIKKEKLRRQRKKRQIK